MSTLFAIALLASGQNSTITGTLAGQIVMEGFLKLSIPNWMRRPKWIKPAYVEIFCGFILFLFTFIEFNNRNALFVSGEWELSQTQYVVEWVTLLLLMFVIITYIATTFTHFLRGKYYYLQLFMISILFFKLLTEFVNIMIHGLLLSIFITPTLILMLMAVIIAFTLQLRERP